MLDRNIGKKMYEEVKNAKPVDAERVFTDEEKAKLAAQIVNGTFKGTLDLGPDPEYVRKAVAKYGWKGVNAAYHPEDYPLD